MNRLSSLCWPVFAGAVCTCLHAAEPDAAPEAAAAVTVSNAVPAAVASNVVAAALSTNSVPAVSNAPGLSQTDAIALLRAADRARGNCEGVVWNVHVRSQERGREEQYDFLVKARGFDVLSETLRPPVSKGNRVLQISNNTWFFKPGLQKPLPVSVRQKMAGNAAYGDIAATNYAEDYEVTPLADADVDGERCTVLDLKAIPGRRCTYDRIVYYISQKRGVGVKAEYYTVSGKLTRSARMSYDHSLPDGDQTRPLISSMAIFDHFVTNSLTTLEFAAPVLAPLPPSTFDVNRLTE